MAAIMYDYEHQKEYTTCSCGVEVPAGTPICPDCEWKEDIQQSDFGSVLDKIKGAAGEYVLDIDPDGGYLEVTMALKDVFALWRVSKILDARGAKYEADPEKNRVAFWLKSGDHGSLDFSGV